MKNFVKVGSLILLTFLTSLTGCLDSDVPDPSIQLAKDVQKIENYLAEKGITDFEKDANGIFYVIHQQGTGSLPLNTHHVNFTYVGKILNSTTTIFEQTSIPVFLTVGNINLHGLNLALPKLAEGTIATLYIPSGYVYGTGSSASIPANSIFVFDVEIFDVATDDAGILEVQKTTIDNYLAADPETDPEEVHSDPSGLRYIIHEQGEGDFPSDNSKISVKYKGTLLRNGVVFDQATSAVNFTLGGTPPLIEGWEEGFKLLKEGTKATLYIPSGLGYGASGSYNQANPEKSIPSHAILVFDVDFIEIVQ